VPRTALVWSDALAAYSFGDGHPLDPRRLRLTLSLFEALGLDAGPDVYRVPARPATESELLAVHSSELLDAVRRASALPPGAAPDAATARELRRFGLGSDDVPIVHGMHDIATLVTGATIVAAEEVMSGRALRAFSIAGGLHHARRSEASGFCVYNDLAAAISWIRQAHGARVLYLDIDAHHGDGVQWLFYDDPDVLTLSIHESGAFLYPGTGFLDELGSGDGYGTSVNIPLDAHTDDDSWRACFDAVVPAAIDAFQPDVIVLQAGCDAHVLDPLTHLRCTTGLYEWATGRVVELADRYCGGRIVATGGGGYAVHTVVPRAWALVFGTLCGAVLPDEVPADWRAAAEAQAGAALPRTLRDPPGAFPPIDAQAAAAATNRQTIGAIRSRVLPLLTGWGMAF
jgi:acetoin utilization protein AcuC